MKRCRKTPGKLHLGRTDRRTHTHITIGHPLYGGALITRLVPLHTESKFWVILAQCFLKRRLFNDPTSFLQLIPLWRGPGPLFVQFWVPFTQGWFLPNLIKTDLLFLEKKLAFPIVASPDPQGPRFEQTWICIISESFHVNPHPIFAYLWLSSLWRGPSPLFEQFWIPFTQG
jgi:hypothetical protein